VIGATWAQALTWRLGRQFLLDRAGPEHVPAVVDRLCGLHAQLMSSVEWSLCARFDGLTVDDVRACLWERRTLVKLWAMRATLHVLAAESLGLFLAGMRAYEQAWTLYGLRDPIRLELADRIATAVRGRVLTRRQLAAAVGQHGGGDRERELLLGGWGGALKPASFLGHLCFGPPDGPRVRFTDPASWLGSASERPDRAAALAEIARRFLDAYGPAGAADLAGWWGVNNAQAADMLASLGEAAVEVDIDGRRLWMTAEHGRELATVTPARVVRLLPAFDQWMVCANRLDGGGSRPGPGLPALHPGRRTDVYRRQGWVSPVLVVDGRIDGVWAHRRTGKTLHVRISPFGRLPRHARAGIDAEVERLARFSCAEPAVSME